MQAWTLNRSYHDRAHLIFHDQNMCFKIHAKMLRSHFRSLLIDPMTCLFSYVFTGQMHFRKNDHTFYEAARLSYTLSRLLFLGFEKAYGHIEQASQSVLSMMFFVTVTHGSDECLTCRKFPISSVAKMYIPEVTISTQKISFGTSKIVLVRNHL